MAIMKFRVPTKEEEQYLQANGIDPNSVTVMLKDENSMVLRNYKTNDDITIHAGPKSMRDFPSVWEGRNRA